MAAKSGPSTDMESFAAHLKTSNRILALLGAGLSAASGLPTFRGAGGMWRNHQATRLATPEAFDANPGLVWQFYNYRRHMALNAKPNPAHYALAELSKMKPDFITLSQNVDGLCIRAGHPREQLHDLHGCLFDLKCSGFYCNYVEKSNFNDPIVPALAIPTEARPAPAGTTDGVEATKNLLGALQGGAQDRELDIANAEVHLPQLQFDDLPLCPKCQKDLLRPGVVWFGESLPSDTLDAVDRWLAEENAVDLVLVIGTSSQVWPAAGYVGIGQGRGARVAVINMESHEESSGGVELKGSDWYFQGDAGKLVPELLESVIGKLGGDGGAS